MISCSASSIVPASVPSVTIALISSSVTASVRDRLILNRVKKRLLTRFNTQTIGWVTLANTSIGPATSLAILSAFNRPILLGMSSPKMMERKVTIITMIVVAMVAAYGLNISIFSTTG